MTLGFGVLKLSPQAFWSMTPRELAAAAGLAAPASMPPSRHALQALMVAHPDKQDD